MSAIAETHITEAEYLRLEELSSIKHEYFNGRIYAMTGGINTHAILCTNSATALVSGLRGSGCRAVGSEQRVKVEATGLLTYPNVSVYCSPASFEGRHNETLLNPQVIIEVLSPSTERYDRTTKFEHYSQIATLTDYLLISQDRVLVEHFRRQDNNSWLLRSFNLREQQVELSDLRLSLSLSDIYDGLQVPAGLLPLRPEDDSHDI